MKGLARSYIWWPGMDKEIEKLAQKCEAYQLAHKAPLPAPAPLHPWEWPDQHWKRVHIDYAGPYQGKMLLIMVDAHTKWIETHMMSRITSSATIRKLRTVFGTHGLPEVLVSDNAANLTSEEMENFMRQNDIIHITSAPYHPATNGLAERAVKMVKDGLGKMTGDSLEVKLQRFLFNYRLTPQTTTGKSPAELLMGWKLKSKFDLLHPQLQEKILRKQSEMKSAHDVRARLRQFVPGDTVYVQNFEPGLKWLPGIIHMKTGPLSYTVVLTDGRACRRHVDHVRQRVESGDHSSQTVLELPVESGGHSNKTVPELPTTMEHAVPQMECNVDVTGTHSATEGVETSVDQEVIEALPVADSARRYPIREHKPPERLDL